MLRQDFQQLRPERVFFFMLFLRKKKKTENPRYIEHVRDFYLIREIDHAD